MPSSKLFLPLAVILAAMVALSACGTDDETTDAGDASVAAETSDDTAEDDDHEGEDDHEGDEDHDDHEGEDDHDGDEDHDDHEGDKDHEDDEHDDHEGEDDHDDHDGDDDHDHDHDEAEGGLGAHEHGVAELSVAWSDGDMVIDLISPTFNIFGFEYEATTDEDLAIVADRTEALTAPGVLVINPEAGCVVDDVTTELEYEGSHAELTASWSVTCENPAEIEQIDAAALFAEFPNLEDVDAQWASEAGQSSAELTPSATVLDVG